jgi:hypothetical protein
MPTPDTSSVAHIADTIIAAYGEHRDHIIRTPAQYRADLINAVTRAREASWDQYAAVCTVIDQAKNDDRSRDTDEYASEILAALAVALSS